MINIQDKSVCPTLKEVNEYVGKSVFEQFCSQIKEKYNCKEKLEYSSCSWEKGWNIKFKKAGRNLCTIYPRAGYFSVMIVVGAKEKESVDQIMPSCNKALQSIYEQTKEGNGQKWMLIDILDAGVMYDDIFRLIEIRRGV